MRIVWNYKDEPSILYVNFTTEETYLQIIKDFDTIENYFKQMLSQPIEIKVSIDE